MSTSEEREIERTRGELAVYERVRHAARSAEVVEVAQRVWAQFASAAFFGMFLDATYNPSKGETSEDGDRRLASECARVADLLLVEWEKRFGMPSEDAGDGEEP